MWFVLGLICCFVAYCWFDSARASYTGGYGDSSPDHDDLDRSSNRAIYDPLALPYDYDPFDVR